MARKSFQQVREERAMPAVLPELTPAEEKVCNLMRATVAAREAAEKGFAKHFEDSTKDVFRLATALDWADGVFEAAARYEVFARACAGCWTMIGEKGMSPEEAIAHVEKQATKEALRGARDPRHSTSPSSNLIDQYRTAAWANLVEKLGGWW